MAAAGRLLQEADELKSEIDSLRTRLLSMSEASLRITGSLDLEKVLQEVVDSARSLTGARYGALTVFGDSGRVQELITSGITAPERRKMGPMPKGVGLIGYLNEVQGPLRLADLSKHPRSAGLPDFLPPMKTFLGSPIRHLGEPVGNIYLTEKEGGKEFTKEDEEALVMFASLAATAISNASTYEDERRARSNAENELERLETSARNSPAGVVVVDSRDRTAVSVDQIKEGGESAVRPYSPAELVVRIESAPPKHAARFETEEPGPFRLAELNIDYPSRGVTLSGRPVKLTPTEYGLLLELSVNAGRVMTHDQLLQQIWGRRCSGDERLLRVFIGSLRRKLGDDAKDPKYIFTEPRVGYRMAKA